jgi:dTDP-glucose 4,6-dehydratase
VLTAGRVGQSYNIAGNSPRNNIEVVEAICDALDAKLPRKSGLSRRDLIKFVSDRPGHDRRYALDCKKITRELGWAPIERFETGIEKTIDWYLSNEWWWKPLREGRHTSVNSTKSAD